MTRRELRKTLSGSGRKWLKGVWEAAERYTLRLSSLSRVTSPLATTLIDDYMAKLNLAGEETRRAFFVTLVAGYSTRAVLAEPTEQPRLKPVPPKDDELEDRVKAIAGERFSSVMTLPPEVWSSYVATAAMKRQKWLTGHKLPWYVLSRERVETLLRWGYALRCLDEAYSAEPVLQEAAPR
ncbi:MAG TPA: hypothetical protein VME22_21380 [Solirubrobacteraceae bacterium]|nr:hypothetical protein [Solirubrobacteraceae bacterium]